jgi:tetratricopeptide (TPR) repeat protein
MDDLVVRYAIESGDAAGALAAFRKLDERIQLTSDVGEKANLYLGKATLHGILGQFSDARTQLNSALRYAPDNADIRLQHDFIDASLYDQERQPELAYLKLTSLLYRYSERLSKPDVRFMYQDIQLRRGFDATSIGSFKEAVPILKECLSFVLKPEVKAIVLSDLGRCYSEAGKYESARDCLSQAIGLGLSIDFEGQARVHLGVACARLGLLVEAKKEFEICAEKAVEYGVEISKIYSWLSWVCEGLGERSESEKYLRLARPC